MFWFTFAAVLIGLTGLNSVSGSSNGGALSPSRTHPKPRRPSIALEVPPTTSEAFSAHVAKLAPVSGSFLRQFAAISAMLKNFQLAAYSLKCQGYTTVLWGVACASVLRLVFFLDFLGTRGYTEQTGRIIYPRFSPAMICVETCCMQYYYSIIAVVRLVSWILECGNSRSSCCSCTSTPVQSGASGTAEVEHCDRWVDTWWNTVL